eukprot:5404845-Pleurochrysis_carterae.AAC.6
MFAHTRVARPRPPAHARARTRASQAASPSALVWGMNELFRFAALMPTHLRMPWIAVVSDLPLVTIQGCRICAARRRRHLCSLLPIRGSDSMKRPPIGRLASKQASLSGIRPRPIDRFLQFAACPPFCAPTCSHHLSLAYHLSPLFFLLPLSPCFCASLFSTPSSRSAPSPRSLVSPTRFSFAAVRCLAAATSTPSLSRCQLLVSVGQSPFPLARPGLQLNTSHCSARQDLARSLSDRAVLS